LIHSGENNIPHHSRTWAAGPTAEWDQALGQTWITPAQLATFIYNSLQGVALFTPAAEAAPK